MQKLKYFLSAGSQRFKEALQYKSLLWAPPAWSALPSTATGETEMFVLSHLFGEILLEASKSQEAETEKDLPSPFTGDDPADLLDSPLG